MKKIFVVIGIICLIVTLRVIEWRSPRVRAEEDHGILLPKTARQIQSYGDAGRQMIFWRGFLDGICCTIFEMPVADKDSFTKQVSVHEVIPFNKNNETVYSWWLSPPSKHPFAKKWDGQETPVEMLYCGSPTGDFMIIEFWRSEQDKLVVIVNTDWN